jgi:hypothetical protein
MNPPVYTVAGGDGPPVAPTGALVPVSVLVLLDQALTLAKDDARRDRLSRVADRTLNLDGVRTPFGRDLSAALAALAVLIGAVDGLLAALRRNGTDLSRDTLTAAQAAKLDAMTTQLREAAQ